ncbi:TetR/AcrR family transcriptional regulator [Schinkia azotoformans]|uniref:TetR/AcrR family transcriptional regulator n=1 Tax=Schinkia azotoformans TaxID=1454 RepID=UPI002DBCE55A|nr:TetR/AcrR family transcriptional regulator [Schinkia azotoformans]MEC1715065.1 TetR/AcrR family transcriptional regulator [Schinkia azotoformans]MEC1745956.1 TetR/AcrR family transcriptional regulator [Schinkia azotoformans]MEC1758390.1 TetR/AcrR family transcriptional regulator [Schinkia azotoformans]MEC1780200.1 TetR/AcrR family transcriptional regulator [Schinkia azotoformans]MED4328577.1 TetR/AcrR family transcriptional regulator [Schinkia azotoformans]
MDKKEKIMQAATQSFSMFGFKGTSVDHIAKIAGVGKGTIYTYFENKEVILQEIIQALIREMKENAENAIGIDRTAFENLHEVLYSVLLYRKEHVLMIKLSQEVKEFATEAAKQALVQIEKELLSYIQVFIEKAIANKKFKECNPEITAFVIFKMYISLVVEWNEKRGTLTNEEVYELFKLYLMEGLVIKR